MTSLVSLVAVTQPVQALQDRGIRTAEDLLVYTARVSNPAGQEHPETGGKLLKYCLDHGHWSVFETGVMTLEIETSVAVATQMLRHRSFTWQQFSARYADVSDLGFEPVRPRRQDLKNRQNSTDDLPDDVRRGFLEILHETQMAARASYVAALKMGVAKESARFLLPQTQTTRLYMTGNVRSWIHYLQARDADGVQQEHRDVAMAAKRVFAAQFPTVAGILGWDDAS